MDTIFFEMMYYWYIEYPG